MSATLACLIAAAMLLVSGSVAVRKFFMTSSWAAYVFMALNWLILIVLAAIFALLVRTMGG